MNNEKYNQIVDEAYKNYNNYMTENYMETRWCVVSISPSGQSVTGHKCNRDEFVSESKTRIGFSERWGLKFEERELSDRERYELVRVNGMCPKYSFEIEDGKPVPNKLSEKEWYDNFDIPTKLITITYKNEKIEVYE